MQPQTIDVLSGNIFIAFLVFVILISLAILIMVCQGMALWRAARNSHKGWFIALLILNTAGILPAIYLLKHKQGNTDNSQKQLPKS